MNGLLKWGVLFNVVTIVRGATATIVKNDFLVNDDSLGECSKSLPIVGMNNAGAFIVAWRCLVSGPVAQIALK